MSSSAGSSNECRLGDDVPNTSWSYPSSPEDAVRSLTTDASREELIDCVCYHLEEISSSSCIVGHTRCIEVGYSTYLDLRPIVRFVNGMDRVVLTAKQWSQFEKKLGEIIQWFYSSYESREFLLSNAHREPMEFTCEETKYDPLDDDGDETGVVYSMTEMEGSREKFLKYITLQQRERSFRMNRFNILEVQSVCNIINFRLDLLESYNLGDFYRRTIDDALQYMREEQDRGDGGVGGGDGKLNYDQIYDVFDKLLNFRYMHHSRNVLCLLEMMRNRPAFILRCTMNRDNNF